MTSNEKFLGCKHVPLKRRQNIRKSHFGIEFFAVNLKKNTAYVIINYETIERKPGNGWI